MPPNSLELAKSSFALPHVPGPAELFPCMRLPVSMLLPEAFNGAGLACISQLPGHVERLICIEYPSQLLLRQPPAVPGKAECRVELKGFVVCRQGHLIPSLCQ